MSVAYPFIAKYEFFYQKKPKRIFGKVELTKKEAKYQESLRQDVQRGKYKGSSLQLICDTMSTPVLKKSIIKK